MGLRTMVASLPHLVVSLTKIVETLFEMIVSLVKPHCCICVLQWKDVRSDDLGFDWPLLPHSAEGHLNFCWFIYISD